MIAIVDYGAGNLRSVHRALAKVGYEAKITSNPNDLREAQVVILPGVGAAGDTVRSLRTRGLEEPVRRCISEDRPFLGICIGLQILFETTEEGGEQPCLGIFPGAVRRLPNGLKVPHMGWNHVRQKQNHPVFDEIPDNNPFYFVHSYCAFPKDPSLVVAETEYGVTFCSTLATGHLVATQFHPEKSGAMGLRFYQNFMRFALGNHPRH